MNFFGPVNYVARSENTNFGPNLGTVNQTSIDISQQSSSSVLSSDSAAGLLLGQAIPDASHTRNLRNSPPTSKCLPGTRTAIIEHILSWMGHTTFDEGAPPRPLSAAQNFGALTMTVNERAHILWICGPVGCGKSAVAQAVSETAELRGHPVASFFFFRGSRKRSRFGNLIVTLASQMALAIPATKVYVETAMKALPTPYTASVATQFERLILRPLRAAQVFQDSPSRDNPSTSQISRPFLIIIDGLDECADREDVHDFLEYIIELFERNPHTPLRILISSRIEEYIREVIDENHVVVLNLGDQPSEADISSVVRHHFRVAAKRSRVIRSYGAGWPTESDISSLLRIADGSFIFVTSLLHYILGLGASWDDGLTPMERFNSALTMNLGLDSLYTEILGRAQKVPNFEVIVWTIASLGDPLPVSALSQLLNVPPFKVVHVLVPLQSIIRVPGDDDKTPVTLFHTSLREFILDPQRSNTIISASQREGCTARLAHRCLAVRVGRRRGGGAWNPTLSAHVGHSWVSHWLDLNCGTREQLRKHLDYLVYLSQKSSSADGTVYILKSASNSITSVNPLLANHVMTLMSPMMAIYSLARLFRLFACPIDMNGPPAYRTLLSEYPSAPTSPTVLLAMAALLRNQPASFFEDMDAHMFNTPSRPHTPILRISTILGFMGHTLGLHGTTMDDVRAWAHHVPAGEYIFKSWTRHLRLALASDNKTCELLHSIRFPVKSYMLTNTFIVLQENVDDMEFMVNRLKENSPGCDAFASRGANTNDIEVDSGMTIADILSVFIGLDIISSQPGNNPTNKKLEPREGERKDIYVHDKTAGSTVVFQAILKPDLPAPAEVTVSYVTQLRTHSPPRAPSPPLEPGTPWWRSNIIPVESEVEPDKHPDQFTVGTMEISTVGNRYMY